MANVFGVSLVSRAAVLAAFSDEHLDELSCAYILKVVLDVVESEALIDLSKADSVSLEFASLWLLLVSRARGFSARNKVD